MILQTFFDGSVHELPDSLIPRESRGFYLSGVLIFVSFVLLAIVKRSNGKSFLTIFQLFFNTKNLEQRVKESLRLSSFASITLLINYVMIFSILGYLFLSAFFNFNEQFNLLISVAFPLALLFIQTIPLLIIQKLCGEEIPLFSITANTFIGLYLWGVISSVVALIWILNPQWGFVLSFVFLGFFGLVNFARFIKNSYLVLTTGVSWYYILLYLCTLEILPLFVAYYYVESNFMN